MLAFCGRLLRGDPKGAMQMVENYFYSASTYLNEWISMDRGLRNSLGFRDGAVLDDELARRNLVEAAAYYSVSRNFKLQNDSPRLEAAWEALKLIRKPNDREAAQEAVNELMEALQEKYKKSLCSAATKFLWLRFGSPVIIYDTVAWNWMCRQGGCLKSGDYSHYSRAWVAQFEQRHEKIAEACVELPSMQRFMRPNNVPNFELQEAITSEWFIERVFDHFMLNEQAEWEWQQNREKRSSSSVQ